MHTRSASFVGTPQFWLAGVALSALVCLSIAAPICSADESAAQTSKPAWAIIPGGIADAAGHVAYVANTTDGITAFDLHDGHTLWNSKDAVHPLALDGDRLIARAPRGQAKVNTLNMVVMDSATGHILLTPQQIVLPDWIAVDGGIGLKFVSTAAIDGRDLVISWFAEREFVGGVPSNAEAIAAAHKIESGKARLDLDNGQTSVLLDDVPQNVKLPRSRAYYDVADKRISSSDSPEDLPGGVRIIHRLLDVRDVGTGRPLWRHEIAGDILLSADAAAKAEKMSSGQQSDRR